MEQPEITQDSVAEEIDTATETTEAVSTEYETDADLGEQAAPGEEEVEYEGEKYKVPPQLKDALLRQADYTRKTQEVAEQRKQIEAQAAEVRQRAEQQQRYVADMAEVVALDKQMQQYQQLDWQELIDTDPQGAMKLQHQLGQLQNKRAELAHNLTQKQQQDALNEQQAIAKRVQEADAYLRREIPNWSDERSNQLMKYGVDLGIQPEVLSQAVINQPVLAKLLHKAEMFDQLEKKQAARPKPEGQEKPVTRITAARSTVQKNPDEMNVEEWTKWRNAQVNKKR
jgi:hypothetical protein